MSRKRGVIISLCDVTGFFVQPWIEAGYTAILVDPQHPEGITRLGRTIRIGHEIDHPKVWGTMRRLIRSGRVVFVAGFPPCTDVAVSGARHWERKFREDRYFQAKAALIADQCRVIGQLSGAPWLFENPVSAFSGIFGPPCFTFHPYEYGAYLPANDNHPVYPEHIKPRDAYPKRTCLWTGGDFAMPDKKPVEVAQGYSDQHAKLGGRSERTKNIRSATPRGFAKAVYLANAPHLVAANDNEPPK